MTTAISIIQTSNGLMTTSKVIADVFEKPHRDVTKAIDALDCSEDFSLRNFSQSEYSTTRGKTYKCYNITEHGFYMLAMGFTGKKAAQWKESFINEFKRLQNGELNIDQRMTAISIDLENIKEDGKAWSKFGSEIKKRKKVATDKATDLIGDVQLKLELT